MLSWKLIGLFLALNDVLSFGLAKAYILNPATAIGLWLPTLLYAFQVPLFAYGLRQSGMAVLNITWNLFSNLLVTLLGVFFYSEKITGLKVLASLFAISSITLFSIDGLRGPV